MVADGATGTKQVCSPIPPVLPYGTRMDPFVYQYAVGGVVFAIGLVYAARQGYIGFRGAPLRNLVILIGGLAFYMALQGYLQYAPMDSLPPSRSKARRASRAGSARRSIMV